MKRVTVQTPVYFATALIAIGLVAFGFFAPASGAWAPQHFGVTSGLLALTAIKLFRLSTREQHTRRDILEAGLLLMLCVQVPIQATGGLASPFLPVMFLLVSLLAAYSDASLTALFVSLATALVVPSVLRDTALVQWQTWAPPLVTYGLTASAFALVVGAFVGLERRRRIEASAALERFQSDADALSAELEAPSADELKPALQAERDRRMREATRALDDSLFNLLEVARGACGAHSVIYFRHDVRADRLRIRQMATDNDHVVEQPLDARKASLLTGVLKTSSPVTLAVAKGRALPYYQRAPKLASAVAVPVREVGAEADTEGEPVLRGVLVADFAEKPESDLTSLLAGFARTVAELERDAREREVHALRAHRLAHYFDTSKQLTSTLALDEILGFAIEASQQLADFDFAAVVQTDPGSKQFQVRKAAGEGEGKIVGKSGSVDGSLVGWVIKNEQYLPVPHFRKRKMRTPLLGKRVDPDGIRSALIFPLARENQAVGAFVVGSLTRDKFDPDEVQVLEGIANQTALAMANSLLYLRMQEMATTDGLTGLPNHRYFQEALTREIDRAQRSQQQVAVILMDVDHFKSVNDSYGHPVGDEVLRRLSRVLKSTLQRTIDLPARYGGEEFVTILPDTDAKGARRVADKIRTALAKERFDGGETTFQVTLSAGVSVYPDDGKHKQELIDHADKALYHSKESGRNRTTLWRDVPRDDATPLPVRAAAKPVAVHKEP